MRGFFVFGRDLFSIMELQASVSMGKVVQNRTFSPKIGQNWEFPAQAALTSLFFWILTHINKKDPCDGGLPQPEGNPVEIVSLGGVEDEGGTVWS